MSAVEPVGPEEVESLVGDVLRRPAAEGARIVALHWLHQLMQQRNQWTVDQSAESLHKARAALRRLRAIAREHHAELGDVFTGRIGKSLRALGRATNAARDRDVQLEWLEAETDALTDTARVEADTLRERLGCDVDSSLPRVEQAFLRHLDTIAPRLQERLSWYDRRERVGQPSQEYMRYSAVVADRLVVGAKRIAREVRRLSDSHGEIDASSENTQEHLHQIRLRLKRHRAMLAPLTDEHPALAALFEFETRSQDLLGAMRDADVLAQRARKERLHALESILADTRLSKLVAFLDEWMDAQDTVRQHFDAAIDVLRMAPVGRDGRNAADVDDAAFAASNHGLPMEIERKFLLRDVPPEAIAMPPITIEQGWIPGTALRERLRRSTYPDGRVRCTRTIKLGRPEARIEIEEDTGNGIFQSMWPLTSSARIRKRRHVVRDAVHVWEIDAFTDRDLVLAEVELDALDTPVVIPAWLAPYVVREVTGEIAYLNSQMARPEIGKHETISSQSQ